jgi:hypothetical protein
MKALWRSRLWIALTDWALLPATVLAPVLP